MVDIFQLDDKTFEFQDDFKVLPAGSEHPIPSEFKEMELWCSENCYFKWKIVFDKRCNRGTFGDTLFYQFRTYFKFGSKKDAMAFKLRWI